MINNITITWWTSDIMDRANELEITISEEEAGEILQKMKDDHDATIGINWDVIDCYLNDLERIRKIPAKPKKVYRVQRNVGKYSYVVSLHGGIKHDEHGIPLYDVRTFTDITLYLKFIGGLLKAGYVDEEGLQG